MKVKGLKELYEVIKNGQFEIEEDTISIDNCEVGFIGEAKTKSGETDGRPWSFRQQFLVVKQGELSVGVNVSEEYGKEIKGAIVSVSKAKVQTYKKDGEDKVSLQVKKGNFTITKQPEKPQPSAQKSPGTTPGEPVDPNVWTNKEIRKAREKALGCALAYLGLGIVTGTGIPREKVIETAKYFENYLYIIEGSEPIKETPKAEPPKEEKKSTPSQPPVAKEKIRTSPTEEFVLDEPIQTQVDKLAAELIQKEIIADWSTWLEILKKFGCKTYKAYIDSDVTTKGKIYAELMVLKNQGK